VRVVLVVVVVDQWLCNALFIFQNLPNHPPHIQHTSTGECKAWQVPEGYKHVMDYCRQMQGKPMR